MHEWIEVPDVELRLQQDLSDRRKLNVVVKGTDEAKPIDRVRLNDRAKANDEAKPSDVVIRSYAERMRVGAMFWHGW